MTETKTGRVSSRSMSTPAESSPWSAVAVVALSAAAGFALAPSFVRGTPGGGVTGFLIETALALAFGAAALWLAIANARRTCVSARQQADTFARLLRSSPDALVIAGDDGRIAMINAAAEELYGFSCDELRGQPMDQLMHGGICVDHVRCAVRKCMGDTDAEPIEVGLPYQAILRDGRACPVEVALSAVETAHGLMIVAAVNDVSGLREVERHLSRSVAELDISNRELEQFAYVASHDLQEPLRMVASYVQLLERRYADKLDDSGREFISYAVDATVRMKRLINDLLAYSRVGTDGEAIRPTDLESVLATAKANLQAAMDDADGEVTCDALPLVEGDEFQLIQLLQNLIGNALKYRGSSPARVHVGVDDGETDWTISVRDHGIGFDSKHVERVFEIFQRLHGISEYEGTGIGLAICQRIVERHGGRIWAESQRGEGSTFSFTLPKVHAEPGLEESWAPAAVVPG